MKLDIEAMAREADKDGLGWLLDEGLVHPDELERLARLIVERCAQECSTRKFKQIGAGEYEAASDCEAAIRNLLED